MNVFLKQALVEQHEGMAMQQGLGKIQSSELTALI